MNSLPCTCRYISLGDDLYEWCRLCGRLVYRYEDCAEIPFSAIINATGSIGYSKADHIIVRTRFVEPSNVRALLDHKHKYLILSATDAWCTICGILRVRRPLGSGLSVEIKEGFIAPQRRQSAIQIRKEARIPTTVFFQEHK